MTEWWVSQAKNWCKICRVWTGGHKGQIIKHETGRAHIENEERGLIDARKRENARSKEEDDVKNQLADIERKALAAMCADAAPPPVPGQAAASANAARIGQTSSARSIADSRLEQAAQKRHIDEVIADAKKRKIDPIAAAWNRHVDPTSQASYYYNTITQASSWEVPVGYIEPAAPAKPKDGPCAAGTAWSCSTDPTSGLQYWYNSASQQSTWEKPGEYVHPTDESEKAAAEAAKAAAKAAAASAGLDHLGNVEGKGAGDALGLLRLPGKSRAEKAIEKLEPAPEAPTTVPMNLAAANMGGAAVLPQAPADSAWVVCTDASTGYVYYFNKLTKESSWEKPADLGLDLSKPPPAPPKKAPPPPAKGEKSSAAAPQVGMWEEVRPEQSQWDAGRKDPTVAAQDKDSDEEREVDPLVAMKFLTAHKGAWMDEDYERHEVEKVEKASSSRPVDVKSTFEKKGDLSFVKRGIRKRDDETDFCNV